MSRHHLNSLLNADTQPFTKPCTSAFIIPNTSHAWC